MIATSSTEHAMRYPIAIELGHENAAYGVVVPDLPGCFSAGDTIDEAIGNVEDAILLYLEDTISDGKAPPRASTLDALIASGTYPGWTWALVNIDLAKISTKSVRVNITVPDKLLNAIDNYAESHGETRSGFLTRAALEAMEAA